jgi:hypothetical protein
MTFEWVFENLSAPRTDCPTELPQVLANSEFIPDYLLPVVDGSLPLSDLQREIVHIAAGLSVGSETGVDLQSLDNIAFWTEEMGYNYCSSRVRDFLLS